jgi:hypothetical protein
MTKLTTGQQALLARATEADDGAIAAEGDPKTIAALIKKRLLISVPQSEGPSRLLITTEGRAEVAADHPADAEPPTEGPQAALANDPAIAETPQDTPDSAVIPAEEASPAAAGPKPKGKIASLVDLLRQPGGTTVEAMMAATGWQAHSVRGAVSGAIKKGLGLAVVSEKTEAGRIYRLQWKAGA